MNRDRLLNWYEEFHRDLPWRRTRDPYRIWLSEVILQQTRVVQGLDYYLRFTERFPTVADLAAASEDEVLKLWQGLGYYSRARNLHAAARQVIGQFGGRFPDTYDGVRSLRGVGDYTAAAVCSIAYDAPCSVVDGNVYRVLSRLFDLDAPIDTSAGKRLFAELAAELFDGCCPGRYNQALMEFGALQCVPRSPDCTACPLADGCLALKNGRVADLPVKAGKTTRRERWFHYLVFRTPDDRTVLHRREAQDVWRGLYEFPLIETVGECDFGQLCEREDFPEPGNWHLERSVVMPKHVLSHQVIRATFWMIRAENLPSGFVELRWDEVGRYAVSRLTEQFLEGGGLASAKANRL